MTSYIRPPGHHQYQQMSWTREKEKKSSRMSRPLLTCRSPLIFLNQHDKTIQKRKHKVEQHRYIRRKAFGYYPGPQCQAWCWTAEEIETVNFHFTLTLKNSGPNVFFHKGQWLMKDLFCSKSKRTVFRLSVTRWMLSLSFPKFRAMVMKIPFIIESSLRQLVYCNL